jgi:hypothetical protein
MKRILWAVLGVSLLSVGCSDPTAPATPTPALPTIAETFSDTLLVAGSNTHNFSVTTVGGVKVTLNSLTPATSVGLGIGTPSLGSCSLIQQLLTGPSENVVLSGTATVPGLYCVTIFDVPGADGTSRIGEPSAYTINVLHS